MKKLFLFDLDGTLVDGDLLDEVCEIVGKKQESADINQAVIEGRVSGYEYLCKRINFLKNVSVNEINSYLEQKQFLRDGAKELFKFLKDNNFITVIASGNIMPTLNYYKNVLNVDYVIGTNVKLKNNKLQTISPSDIIPNFKFTCCNEIIKKENIKPENIYAIGDSAVDIKMLSLAKHTFAINPKGGLENNVNKVVNSLKEIIEYIKNN